MTICRFFTILQIFYPLFLKYGGYYMSIVTEIVTFKIVESIDKDEFFNIVDILESNFHSKLSGFIDTELLYNDKLDEWIMIQHWNNLDNAQSASKKMFNNPVTEEFVRSIQPNTVKMLKLEQLGVWNI
jgi:hypothetical protein